jgi:ornithine cyclodeaminase
MTSLVDVRSMTRWIRDAGLGTIVRGMVEYLDVDFRRWERFDKVPRVASHTPFGVIGLMPTSDGREYAFKYVNGHPENPARGFQTVTAFGVLADVHNGYPTFVAEITLLTALRTAATSALAARTLARPDSTVMALVGAGSQSEFQAVAFRELLGIESVRVFDTDPDAMAKLSRNLLPLGFEVTGASSAGEAAHGADIVTVCTADKTRAVVLSASDIDPGTHINALGGDCPGKTELDPAILSLGTVFVEYPPQTRIEGEIQQMPESFPVTELWRVLTGTEPGRVGRDEITTFDSVGFAIEDFSALRFVRDQVAGTAYTKPFDLIVAPDDPKDLFGLVGSLAPVS